MLESAQTIPAAELEAATDEVIAACEGDPRAAVKALLSENAVLEDQLSRLSSRISSGYARGRAYGR